MFGNVGFPYETEKILPKGQTLCRRVLMQFQNVCLFILNKITKKRMIRSTNKFILIIILKHLFTQKDSKDTLVNYLVSKILGKIQGTEMLVDLENLGTR